MYSSRVLCITMLVEQDIPAARVEMSQVAAAEAKMAILERYVQDHTIISIDHLLAHNLSTESGEPHTGL